MVPGCYMALCPILVQSFWIRVAKDCWWLDRLEQMDKQSWWYRCIPRKKLGILVGERTWASLSFRAPWHCSGDIIIIALFYISIRTCISPHNFEQRNKFPGTSLVCISVCRNDQLKYWLLLFLLHIQVYGVSWIVIFVILAVMKVSSKMSISYCIHW